MKQKAFTLIELLAVIVILGILAVITIPIILNITENARIGAIQASAYGYKDAVEKYYVLNQDDETKKLNGEYIINNNGSISNEEGTHPILINGTIPRGGYLSISNSRINEACIEIEDYAVKFEDGSIKTTKKGTCNETVPEIVIETFNQVEDPNRGIICGTKAEEEYDDNETCYIYSVEDLVEFSNMVNSGKNFENKTVILMNNLDIENDKSYSNPNEQLGDINNDTITETIKEELTNKEKEGFTSIGTSTNSFMGTFDGNSLIIKNIYINKENATNVGLFGFSKGTIKGLKAENINITGYENVGLVGCNKGTATSLVVDGTVKGRGLAALACGYNDGGTVEAIVSGDVISKWTNRNSSPTGGVVGKSMYGKVRGVFRSGSVTNPGNPSYPGSRTVGSSSSADKKTIALDSILVGNETLSTESLTDSDGYTVPTSLINNIAINDEIIDTYIGGDDNNDGYYYDYNSEGNFDIYSLSKRNLNITMEGSGTQNDPYRIENYEDLKQVAYKLGTQGSGIYYRLDADIDLSNKNSIMLSNYTYENHKFTGVFDGNGKTISNLNLLGYQYVGLFGYNEGTVKGFKTENINIIGYANVGLVGCNKGTATTLVVDGTVKGRESVALACGYNDGGTVEAIVSGDVISTWTNRNYPPNGGVVGRSILGNIRGAFISGSVTNPGNPSYPGTRGIGSTNSTDRKIIALDSILVGNETITSQYETSNDGKSCTAAQLRDPATYAIADLNFTETDPTKKEYRYNIDNDSIYVIKNISQ